MKHVMNEEAEKKMNWRRFNCEQELVLCITMNLIYLSKTDSQIVNLLKCLKLNVPSLLYSANCLWYKCN